MSMGILFLLVTCRNTASMILRHVARSCTYFALNIVYCQLWLKYSTK
jgi:hypothetical protein